LKKIPLLSFELNQFKPRARQVIYPKTGGFTKLTIFICVTNGFKPQRQKLTSGKIPLKKRKWQISPALRRPICSSFDSYRSGKMYAK
jgi:hypothetical protein